MKKFLKYIFLSLLAVSVFSCTQSEDDPTLAPDIKEKEKVKVAFTLSLSSDSSASRSSEGEENWGENQENTNADSGVDYDNQIDLNGLQVVLYYLDGTYAGKVEELTYVKTAQTTYEFDGTVNERLEDGSYKVMVFANCPEVSDETALAELSFSHNMDAGIPMWGFMTCNLSLIPGNREHLGIIPVLRAMAKVEVSLSGEMIESGYTLNDVTLNVYNRLGHCLPMNYNLSGATNTEDLLVKTNTFNPLGTDTDSDLSFKEVDGVMTVYVPEYDNTSANATKAVMIVTVNDEDYSLYFKDYSTDEDFDIVRNHYYRYVITGISESSIVCKLYYYVSQWDEEEIRIPPFN